MDNIQALPRNRHHAPRDGHSLENMRARLRFHVTRLQGEQRKRGPAVGDEVPRIGVQRACPPAARFALVRLQPLHAALHLRIVGRHACLRSTMNASPVICPLLAGAAKSGSARNLAARLPRPQASGEAKVRIDQPPSAARCFSTTSRRPCCCGASSSPGQRALAHNKTTRP